MAAEKQVKASPIAAVGFQWRNQVRSLCRIEAGRLYLGLKSFLKKASLYNNTALEAGLFLSGPWCNYFPNEALATYRAIHQGEAENPELL